MKRTVIALVASMSFMAASPLVAHDVGVTSVARVFIDQMGPQRYILSVVDIGLPELVDAGRLLPGGCKATTSGDLQSARMFEVPTLPFECTSELTIDDVIVLPWDLDGVVAVARWSDGSTASVYFRGQGPSVTIYLGDLQADVASHFSLAGRYGLLGAEHILFGIDHLLFVLGLLFLVRGVVPLVKTITAFTVAHSITLVATVFGWVTVKSGPVEAAIALSIVLLAREIVVGAGGRSHLMRDRPWLVALAFGLLHGFGFAGALGEIGLRSADIPLALLTFNVGVEVGQLGFVALVLWAHRAMGGGVRSRLPRLEPALGYALGTVATLWLVDRLPAVLGA